MCLTAVMDLVLEDMQQQPVASFDLNAGIPVYFYVPAERGLRQCLADGNQPLVHGRLLALKIGHRGAGFGVCPRLGTEPAALKAVDVEPVDDQDMIERGLETRKEADTQRLEFMLSQSGARAE